jgi:hypothetical protein
MLYSSAGTNLPLRLVHSALVRCSLKALTIERTNRDAHISILLAFNILLVFQYSSVF